MLIFILILNMFFITANSYSIDIMILQNISIYSNQLDLSNKFIDSISNNSFARIVTFKTQIKSLNSQKV